MYLTRHGFEPETVIEKTQDSVLLELKVNETADFFEGHFPEIRLLPAVAQVDIMFNMAKKYLSVTGFASATKRTKFGAPVFPNTTVRLFIKFSSEKNSLTYKFSSADGVKSYSSGTFSLGEGASAS